MKERLKQGPALEAAVRTLEQSRSTSPDGASFGGWYFDDALAVLQSVAKFGDDICEADRRRILRRAVSKVVGQTITVATIGKALDDGIREHHRIRARTFILASSISAGGATSLPRVHFDDASILFSARLPRSIRREFITRTSPQPPFLTADGFTSVRVRVEARTPDEAYERASDSLAFLRGAWNLSLNMALFGKVVSDETQPLNKILPGPIHTLHEASGEPAIENYWYEPFFKPSRPSSITKTEWTRTKRHELQIRALIRRSPYPDTLRSALIRYCRALDNRDSEMAFVQLWGILEWMTCNEWGTQSETARRALNAYADTTLISHVLDILRHQRNATVHAGRSSAERYWELVRLHRYVVDLFLQMLNIGVVLSSLDDWKSFLCLPRERSDLQREVRLRTLALRFRTPEGVKLRSPRR